MIEYALAAEFDNKLGAGIVAAYPKRDSNDSDHLLADYLIPDGMHRTDKDSYVFKSVIGVPARDLETEAKAFNHQQTRVNLFSYSNGHKSLHDGVQLTSQQRYAFVMEIVQLKFLSFKYSMNGQERHKVFVFHAGIDIKQLSDRSYTLTAEDDTVFIIEFDSNLHGRSMHYLAGVLSSSLTLKKRLKIVNDEVVLKCGWFYCLCTNKKDSSNDRGAIFRSIALFSSKINVFDYFKPIVARSMDVFARLSSKSTWSHYEQESVQGLMRQLHQDCNAVIDAGDIDSLTVNASAMADPFVMKDVIVRQGFGEPQKIRAQARLFGASSKLLLDLLGPSVMVLYRALLTESNIVFFGDKLKVDVICSLVNSTSMLLSPLSVVDRLFPFEHVQSLDIVKDCHGFVAGYTNPLVKQAKVLPWDFMVDISAKTIVDSSLRPPQVSIENDRVFIEHVIRKTREDSLDATEIDMMFYEYTKTNLDMMMNRSNLIRFDKEDSQTTDLMYKLTSDFRKTRYFSYLDIDMKNERDAFQQVYGKRYLTVYQSYKLMVESDKFDDMDLIVAFESLRTALTDADKVDFFLRKVNQRMGDLECMNLGLYSDDQAVRDSNHKVLALLEVSNLWRDYMSASSLFKSILMNESTSRVKPSSN